jgi:hypothetical protein
MPGHFTTAPGFAVTSGMLIKSRADAADVSPEDRSGDGVTGIPGEQDFFNKTLVGTESRKQLT